jgi:hypothetical protein
MERSHFRFPTVAVVGLAAEAVVEEEQRKRQAQAVAPQRPKLQLKSQAVQPRLRGATLIQVASAVVVAAAPRQAKAGAAQGKLTPLASANQLKEI